VTSPLRILLLEDNSTDAELIQELLKTDGLFFEITRVQTRLEFEAALSNVAIDLILADYQLPSFDGLSALKLAQGTRPDLPFIFVSGTLGEEVAIEALKIGATDYVLKTSLSRLVPSCTAHCAKLDTEPNARRLRRRCAGARCTSPRHSD
jgi:CheY-like chemotaxis protein